MPPPAGHRTSGAAVDPADQPKAKLATVVTTLSEPDDRGDFNEVTPRIFLRRNSSGRVRCGQSREPGLAPGIDDDSYVPDTLTTVDT